MPPPLCAKKILPNFQPKKGFATLLAILVILAAGVSFALLSLSLATGLTRSTLDLEKYKEAQTLTDLCAELSIEKIRDDPNFTGEENFSFDGDECNYTISSNIEAGSIEWQVNAEGLASGAVRKIQLSLEGTVPPEPELPLPVLSSWREVASF